MANRRNTGPEIFLKCLLIFMVTGPIFSVLVANTKPTPGNLRVPEQVGGFLLVGAVGAIAIPALMMVGTKIKT